MASLFIPGVLGFWHALHLKGALPFHIALLAGATMSIIYFWMWNSLHSAYHRRYIPVYQQVPNPKNGPDSTITVWGIPPFVPNMDSPIYRWFYKEHTLHHMNKGISKGNFNILLPFADFLMGTYTSRVDNRKHFMHNKPKTEQERWLSQHQVFDIQVLDNNRILYREDGSDEWKLLPKHI